MENQNDILLALLLLGLLGLALSLFIASLGETKTEAKTCEGPHSWSTNPETEKLQCTRCNYVAGTHKTESGEY